MQTDTGRQGAEAVLAGLDPEQRAVALAARGPVCVLAGAGTGKTRAITHRIAYAAQTGVIDPARVLALTFTVRAAGELRARLRQLGGAGLGTETVRAATFHAAALRQLTYFWPRVVGGRPPALLESKVALLAEAARMLRVRTAPGVLPDVAAEIEWAKVLQIKPDGYEQAAARAGRMPPGGAAEVAGLYAAYEKLRRERHLIDFESVLELTAALLADSREAAEQVRDLHRYFVVDEYQDVNPLQKLLLDVWLGDRDDLCVVGDPDQTIYSFTGATHGYLTRFTAEFPGATVVRLIRDYRSTPQVVAVAGRIAGAPVSVSGGRQDLSGRARGRGNRDRVARDRGDRDEGERDLQARRRGSGAPAVALVAQRPPGPEPVLASYGDELAEAAGVAAHVCSLTGAGVPPREIAVLVRVNAHMERFEQAFAEAGVPYQVRGAERFYDRPEVRQAIMLLRGALRAARAEGAGGARAGRGGRIPGLASGTRGTAAGDGGGAGDGRGTSDGRTGSGAQKVGDVWGTAGGVFRPDGGLPGEVRHILSGLGLAAPPAPASGGAARQRWESLTAIEQLAADMHAARPGASLADFVAELEQRAALGHAPVMDGVTLASMHAAKGLEWDAVILPGLVEGVMPIVHARTPEAVEEERRLLYVAVTRARERLFLSWAAARGPGDPPSRQRSRFLSALARGAEPGEP